MANKYLTIGPGGRNCSCCFPPPRKRKAEYRKAKRAEKRAAMKVERDNMEHDKE